jgi:hypothetical protein
LFFHFGSEFSPTDKLINVVNMSINAADLSGLVATNPATYTSGYPPVYTDPAKNPLNIDISSRGLTNFSSADDLPALVYNVSILDIHGNANICGPIYSPSFAELENKQDFQVQYFRGPIIGGGGIYLENGHESKSIFCVAPQSLAIAACASNNLACKANGSVAAWGDQSVVPAGLSNVVSIAAGAAHSTVLLGDELPPRRCLLTNACVRDHRFSVSLPTQSGRVYALEYKESLADAQWTALPLVAGNGTLQTLLDDSRATAQRFYRARRW